MASPQHERAASAASEKGDMSFNASVEYRKSLLPTAKLDDCYLDLSLNSTCGQG